jgi:hypothetical protein
VLFHNKYLETPETWRAKPGQPEMTNIVASTVIGFVSCAAFIYLCYWTGALSVRHASLRMAVLAWLAAPLPLILTNALWIKMHPLLALSHSLGWLAGAVCRHGASRGLANSLVSKCDETRGTYSPVLNIILNFDSLTACRRFCLGVGVQSRPIW